jgi:integrase
MKGHLRERSPGKWAIVIDLGREWGGRRRQKWIAFRGTKRQAQLELHRLITERNVLPVRSGRTTLAEYLEKWIGELRVGPRATERYSEIIRKNIIPALGNVPLSKLTGEAISNHYTKALASGRRDGTGGLAPATVKYQHVILKKALRQAVGRGLLARNPMDSVDPPHVEKPTVRTIDLDQAGQILEAARRTRLFIPALLALTCGLRRGEITALRWASIDLDNATLTVIESTEQTVNGTRLKRPKSGRGRVIDLPKMAVTELSKHRARQEVELEKIGERLTPDTFVYCREDGEPIQPRSLTHVWEIFVADRKPRVRFHDLRHAHASHLLASGVHPKVAQERLGHSSVAITMDIYSHVLPGVQAAAVKKVGDALRAAMARSRDD